MIIKRRGYKTKGLTFEEFISKQYLIVVITGVPQSCGCLYFEATIEHQDGAEYYIANASGTKIRNLMGGGTTEKSAIKELAWQCQRQHIGGAGCIKVPVLRINYEN